MIAHDPDDAPLAASPSHSTCCVETHASQLPTVLEEAPTVFERLIRPRCTIPALTLVSEEHQYADEGSTCPSVPVAFVNALEEYTHETLLQSMGIAPGMHWQHLIAEVRNGLTNLLHELLHAVHSMQEHAVLPQGTPHPKSADYLAEGIVEYGTQLFFEDFVTALGIPNPEQILGSPNHVSRMYSEQAAAVRTLIESFCPEFDVAPRSLLRQMLQYGGYPEGFLRFLERIGTKSGLTPECTHSVLVPDMHAQLDQLIDSTRPLRHDAEESGRFIGYLLAARIQQTIATQRKVLPAPFSMN